MEQVIATQPLNHDPSRAGAPSLDDAPSEPATQVGGGVTAGSIDIATIERISNGEVFRLYPGFTVGRSHRSSLYLTDRRVSGLHAEIRWTGSMWAVKDKSSANGTYVDGVRLPSGTQKIMVAGTELAFGDRGEKFKVVSDCAPEPVAHAANGQIIFGEDGVLALPNGQAPTYLIRQAGGSDKWCLETNDQAGEERKLGDGTAPRMLANGEQIQCQGVSYRLSLPMHWERTWRPDEEVPTVANVVAKVLANATGSFASMTIVHGEREIKLRPRAHGEVILFLAEALDRDQRDPDLPEHERGWVVVEDLLKRLDINELQLNLYVHRARDQVAKAGVIDAKPRLIERRHNGQCRQIRLGVRRIEL